MKEKLLQVVKVVPVLSLVSVSMVFAAGIPAPVTNKEQLNDVLCTFIAYFFWFVITMSVIMVLWAAFTYATARDDQEKTIRARRTLTYSAVGVAVALLALGFPSIVGSLFPNLTQSINLQCAAFGG